jgi:catechol 2,3-dioxygenase-like lactoylglutathione lyase family enzyme
VDGVGRSDHAAQQARLHGRVIHENDHQRFVTYDDEHHRIALLDFGPLAPRVGGETELMVKTTDTPGVHHVAFTFASMGELLGKYMRLKTRGIVPFFCVNHGRTTSVYYRDPDALVKKFESGIAVTELVQRD